eukprot:CAMPEP_0115151884 /NCGR_PEP_ID=MMETSP0227-20121206/65852_1 /TAXON_ID=89957 /ORGANISM="Polarella glacialis, Strain CCMP 1383" /LENGTH=581 /DNA_ID=CAMNT_0002562429 /DNA_START=55 /DNA_END=1800 /DNA_ORIENTATION=-
MANLRPWQLNAGTSPAHRRVTSCGLALAVLFSVAPRLPQAQQLDPKGDEDDLNVKMRISVDGVNTNVGVVLDAGWRWTYDGAKKSCDPAILDGRGMELCFLQGLRDEQYEKNYGIMVGDPFLDAVTLRYAAKGQYNTKPNYGQRVYITDTTGYHLFKPMGGELAFTVDLSQVPAGMNAAVYLVSMDALGHLGTSQPTGIINDAGWKRGVGYCDAQCPTDVNFVQGQGFNVGNKLASCCPEMDLFEANRFTTAMTAHPCKLASGHVCDTSVNPDCQASCDKEGADVNPFRFGGPGNALFELLDLTKPVRVRTFFQTDDGSSTGKLVAIEQVFEQDHSRGIKSFAMNLTDESAAKSKKHFGAVNMFGETYGGLEQMGKALELGMVMVLALWSQEGEGNMNWLDSCAANPHKSYNCSDHATFDSAKVFKDAPPGTWRGPADYYPQLATSFNDRTIKFSYPGIPSAWKTQSKFSCDGCTGNNSATTCDCSGVNYQFVVSSLSVKHSATVSPSAPVIGDGSDEVAPPAPASAHAGLTKGLHLLKVVGIVSLVFLVFAISCCCCCSGGSEDFVLIGPGPRRTRQVAV